MDGVSLPGQFRFIQIDGHVHSRGEDIVNIFDGEFFRRHCDTWRVQDGRVLLEKG